MWAAMGMEYAFHADNTGEYGGSYLERFDISEWSATGRYESSYYGSTSSSTVYETGNIVEGLYEGEVQMNNSDGTSWADPYLHGLNVNPDVEGAGVGFDPDLPAPYVNIEFMLPINNPNWNVAN
jgi:hypothetical protein